MRAISLKLVISAFLAVLFVTGCSSTKTGGGGETEMHHQGGSELGGGHVDGMVHTEAGAAAEAAAAALGNVIYFDFDKSSIRSDAIAILDAQAKRLIATGDTAILEGNTDERGTREYNMALGERRAKSVKSYLVNKGVNPAKLEVISYGEERPVALGHTEEAYALNRRVVIK